MKFELDEDHIQAKEERTAKEQIMTIELLVAIDMGSSVTETDKEEKDVIKIGKEDTLGLRS